MQEKGCLVDASELGKASFRVAPEALYAIDMATLIGKFIVSVVDPEMLLVPNIYQAVIATPSVGMDDAFDADSASDNRLKRGTAAIRHDLGIDLALALEDAKDNGFAACATTSEPFDSARPEVAFINFDFSENGGLALAVLGDSLAQGHEIPVHGISVQASHQGDLGGIQIKGKELQELPEFGL